MPELPEVETVRRSLFNQIADNAVADVLVHYDGILNNISTMDFREKIIGRSVMSIDRRGKYLIINYDNGMKMVVHLRMTGQLIYHDMLSAEYDKHTHIVLKFNNDAEVIYRDIRKFGRFYLIESGCDLSVTGINKLGPEPLSEQFAADYLYDKAQKRKIPIKVFMLDQHIVAGIGNIYVDEILYDAEIHPNTMANKLSYDDISKIVYSTKNILKKSIELRGTTFSDYRDAYGNKGEFQNYLKVFKSQGKCCEKCGQVIVKTKLRGRGTHYCPGCQIEV